MHPDLTHVEERDLEAILGERAGLAPETVKSIRSSLVGFYKWAKRRGNVDVNPAGELEPVRVPSVPKVADDADLEAMLITASARDRALILLGREAWLRESEIATLTTSMRNGSMLRVTGKGGRTRLVSIPVRPLDESSSASASRAAAATSRAGSAVPYTPSRCTRSSAASPAGIPTRCGTAARPPAARQRMTCAVQRGLGHSSIATTERYVHVGVDELEAAFAGGSLGTARVDVAA